MLASLKRCHAAGSPGKPGWLIWADRQTKDHDEIVARRAAALPGKEVPAKGENREGGGYAPYVSFLSRPGPMLFVAEIQKRPLGLHRAAFV